MEVIDNILPAIAFKKLSDYIMSHDFSWHYGRQVDSDHIPTKNLYLNGWGTIAYLDDFTPAPEWKIIGPFILDALERAGQRVNVINRVRIILNTAAPDNYENIPHVDWNEPHRTALIYMNDSDGLTTIYKEKYDLSRGLRVSDFYNQYYRNNPMTVLKQIEPTANRLVWFDGHHFHAGQTPSIVDRRVIININYTVKE